MEDDVVTISRQEYEDLVDIRDASRVRSDVEAGRTEMIGEGEVDAYIGAPTPLAFWRNKRGLSRDGLAQRVGMEAGRLAEVEAGRADLSVGQLAAAAAALRVRMEDLLA